MGFFEELKKQRWDDHRYYHHNRINQFLHFLSALSFLASYVIFFYNPAAAVLIGWLLAMVLRQIGHFVFEPKTRDEVYDVSHNFKESVKVGYNLRRKVFLLSIWGLAPVVLYFKPDFFGLLAPVTDFYGYANNVAMLWLVIGAAALVLRTVYLFFIMGVQSGLVWFTKILTDPFHDVKIYYRSFFHLLKGEMYDNMSEWYEPELLKNKS